MRRRCAWPQCRVMVPSRLWGCRDHWFRLPLEIRRTIQQHYRPGQEDVGGASAEYLEALMSAARWIRDYGGAA